MNKAMQDKMREFSDDVYIVGELLFVHEQQLFGYIPIRTAQTLGHEVDGHWSTGGYIEIGGWFSKPISELGNPLEYSNGFRSLFVGEEDADFSHAALWVEPEKLYPDLAQGAYDQVASSKALGFSVDKYHIDCIFRYCGQCVEESWSMQSLQDLIDRTPETVETEAQIRDLTHLLPAATVPAVNAEHTRTDSEYCDETCCPEYEWCNKVKETCYMR